LRAISRFFSCSSNLRRRTSLILRIDNLLAGIRFLLEKNRGDLTSRLSSARFTQKDSGIVSSIPGMLSTHSKISKKWTTSCRNPRTTSSGIGGQLRLELVDNLPRNTQETHRRVE